MSARIIDGKALAKSLRVKFRQRVEGLVAKGVRPGLAVILMGENSASKVYVGYAIRRAQMRIDDDFFATLADQEMTSARFNLLLIRENSGIRSVDLARSLEVVRSGMVRLINELERRGLITRETYRKDCRN